MSSLACARTDKLIQYFKKKKAKPDTFTLALIPDHIHSVIPVAGSNKREPVIAKSKPMQDRTFAMFV